MLSEREQPGRGGDQRATFGFNPESWARAGVQPEAMGEAAPGDEARAPRYSRWIAKLRLVARFQRNSLLFLTGCLWWAKWRLRRQGATVVLMFHRVLSDEERSRSNSLGSVVMRAETFERLARYLRDHCEVVDFGGGAGERSAGKRPRVAVTFDDGWLDSATTAFPIAKKHGLPFTVFVCPALMGAHRPFWPEQVIALLKARNSGEPLDEAAAQSTIDTLKTTPPPVRQRLIHSLETPGATEMADGDSLLTWESAAALQRSGIVSIGSHTRSHPLLTQVPPYVAQQELVEAKREIESRLGAPCRLLAYPNGNLSDDICALARNAGYSMAFTTECGAWTKTTDPFRIPRTNAAEDNFIGAQERFSRLMAEYTLFWRAYRASLRQQKQLSRKDPSRVGYQEQRANAQISMDA